MQFLARGKLRASLHYKLASSAVLRNIYKNSPAFFTHSKPVLAGHAMLGWLKITKDSKTFNFESVVTQIYTNSLVNADSFYANDTITPFQKKPHSSLNMYYETESLEAVGALLKIFMCLALVHFQKYWLLSARLRYQQELTEYIQMIGNRYFAYDAYVSVPKILVELSNLLKTV